MTQSLPPIPVEIRPFRPADLADCRRLYVEGLIGGRIAENDTGADIDDIESAYMRDAGSRFWVAINPEGRLVGTIGVQNAGPDVGEIRRLRVQQDHRRRGIGFALVETAVKFCKDNAYIKVTLDTFLDREPAIRLFEKFNFRHNRTKVIDGKEVKYFYLDLYQSESKPPTKLS